MIGRNRIGRPSRGFEIGACCTGMRVAVGNAQAVAQQQLVHDQPHLRLGEAAADAHVRAAAEGDPLVRVALVLGAARREALRIPAERDRATTRPCGGCGSATTTTMLFAGNP